MRVQSKTNAKPARVNLAAFKAVVNIQGFEDTRAAFRWTFTAPTLRAWCRYLGLPEGRSQ
jgi:hypothetical protein